MNEIVKKDILGVLLTAIDILKSKEESDVTELSGLSNHTIHNSSIFQDEDSISIAILIYALSKVIQRQQRDVDYNNILSLLQESADLLSEDKTDGYREAIKKMFKLISALDSKLSKYIEETIKEARIKKGSKLYEHGLSMTKAAYILGISQWELMNYVGKTQMHDEQKEGINIRSRLSFTRNLFT